ncbi:MAG: PDZ domain-containing protein [Planctomycetota bacterium]|nr:PDZ domain-containing protein [Planctomycetota bacterium]
MSVSTINIFAWTASLALTGGLGAYGYKNIKYLETDKPYSTADTEGNARAKAALNAGKVVKVDKGWKTNYQKQVVPNFVDHNWTGKEEIVVKPDEPKIGPVVIPDVKIADIVQVIYFQVDTGDAGGSRVLVRYIGALASHGTAELRVADVLPSPHDGIAVVGITAESVEFSFSKEGRDNETFLPGMLDSGLIYVIPADGEELKVKWETAIVDASNHDTRPQDTVELSKNTYQLGVNDAREFGDNYQTILNNDVRTQTRRDKNGNPNGIEIKSVTAGSIAARHGLSARDVVISVNGHPVNSEQEAMQWAKANKDNYTVWEVVVERLGRTETMIYRSPDN